MKVAWRPTAPRRADLLARLLLLVALLAVAVPTAADAESPMNKPARDVVLIAGRGWGHGVGMAQDGALAMGRAGAPAAQILGHFYPGTAIGSGSGTLRVNVWEPTETDIDLVLPQGGDVRSPEAGRQRDGFPITVQPGGSVRIRNHPDGSIEAIPLRGATRAPGTGPAITTKPAWAFPAAGGTVHVAATARTYRGFMEITDDADRFRAVNHVDVEQYLRGMGEVRDSSWPMASLQTQAIAARTYALWYDAARGELCDTQRCQVYLGVEAEYAAMDQAVTSTAGQILVHEGRIVQAVYSANAGGHLASPEEGFGNGVGDAPYLRPAPYPTDNPMPWVHAVRRSDLGAILGLAGPVDDVSVTRAGPSGRALEITARAGEDAVAITGLEFDATVGLRSNLISEIRFVTEDEATAAVAAATNGELVLGTTTLGVELAPALGESSTAVATRNPSPKRNRLRTAERAALVPQLSGDESAAAPEIIEAVTDSERLRLIAAALLALVIVGHGHAAAAATRRRT